MFQSIVKIFKVCDSRGIYLMGFQQMWLVFGGEDGIFLFRYEFFYIEGFCRIVKIVLGVLLIQCGLNALLGFFEFYCFMFIGGFELKKDFMILYYIKFFF